jgi:hypothetical protein
MNNRKPTGSPLRLPKNWRIKLGAVLYMAGAMTVLAPISPLHTPPLDPIKAQAEPLDLKDYAYKTGLTTYGWNKQQSKCLNQLWGKESNWNPLSDNPDSTAFGIAQMLGEDSTDPTEQIRNGLRYIEHRYENPCNAWEFWKRNYWY